jgi:hypothetical protein
MRRVRNLVVGAFWAGLFAVERHVGEIGLTAAGVVLSSVLLASFRELGLVLLAAVLVGGPLSIAFTEQSFRTEQRRGREHERDEEQRGSDEMRAIAVFAREILLDQTIWTDVEGVRDYADGDVTVTRKRPPLPRPVWSIAAIVARGQDALKPLEIRGWRTIAQLIRDHAAYLTTRIDQEFPGQPAERRKELATLFRAASTAVERAEYLSAACRRVRELAPDAARDEHDRAREAVVEGAHSFFGACEWVQGCVERLDDRPEVAESIAVAAAGHRAAAAKVLAAQREIQGVAAKAAEQVLRDAAPAAAYLARSSLHDPSASIRDIARATTFAFDGAEEEQALNDWKRRIGPAQRSFHLAVMDRGGEMTEPTLSMWRQIHNEGLSTLEQAIDRLEGDVRAWGTQPPPGPSMVDRIAENVRSRRDDLRRALTALVTRVDELVALRID